MIEMIDETNLDFEECRAECWPLVNDLEKLDLGVVCV